MPRAGGAWRPGDSYFPIVPAAGVAPAATPAQLNGQNQYSPGIQLGPPHSGGGVGEDPFGT